MDLGLPDRFVFLKHFTERKRMILHQVIDQSKYKVDREDRTETRQLLHRLYSTWNI